MAVESENVEQLREWLAQGGPVRSACTAADVLADKLAVVVFESDAQWPERADQVDDYRDRLRDRFADDTTRAYHFVELTAPGADPDVFVDWFLRVVTEWEQTAPDGAGLGLPNPHTDGTPGTEYYRLDPVTQEYLYAPTADSHDWATYDRRRYAEPTHHHAYGLDYRYDRLDSVHQWYDETTATWQDQAWADEHAAREDAGPVPRWDHDWQMFHRVGRDGTHEFADAVTPGDRFSGCGDTWLTHAEVLERDAPEKPAAPAAETAAPSGEDSVRATVASVLRENRDLREGLTPEEVDAVIADLIRTTSSN
ncbi:hypothetical protein [Streptomyces fuscichromogenes]|uniref:Uncharacterized protein n=1 Tax=Streptomyces fuscichromogenes TaxID=1324013 RepID=A0A917XIY0_9ACTN|nr:hypothetical protein [Streptomyces fuscichromogenes]GGN28026.1 hypothetical protein GCM10011578_063770 [Streptomyces fuscichromogenes]